MIKLINKFDAREHAEQPPNAAVSFPVQTIIGKLDYGQTVEKDISRLPKIIMKEGADFSSYIYGCFWAGWDLRGVTAGS